MNAPTNAKGGPADEQIVIAQHPNNTAVSAWDGPVHNIRLRERLELSRDQP